MAVWRETRSPRVSAANPWVSGSLLADAIKLMQRPHKNLPLRYGRRRVALITERVAAHDVELPVALEDIGDAVIVGQIDVPVGEDRRRAVMPAELLHEGAIAGLRFEARQPAEIGHHVEVLADGERRRHVG